MGLFSWKYEEDVSGKVVSVGRGLREGWSLIRVVQKKWSERGMFLGQGFVYTKKTFEKKWSQLAEGCSFITVDSLSEVPLYTKLGSFFRMPPL